MILRGHIRAGWVLYVFGFFIILAAPTFFHLWQLEDFAHVRLYVGKESIAALHQGLDALTVPFPITSSTQLISTGAAPEDSVLNKLHNLLGAPVEFIHPLPGYASEPPLATSSSSSSSSLQSLSSADPWATVAERSSKEPSIAICALIRNESGDLDEWIAFHWLQGVRKFFLYDDQSTDNTPEVLDRYIQRGIVKYRAINGTAESAERKRNGTDVNFQMKYLNQCLEEALTRREESGIDWVLFSDADEYLYPNGLNITVAQALDSLYRGQPCITFFRVDFGTSGHIDRPQHGLLIENYVHAAHGIRVEPKKYIINLRPANATEAVSRLGKNPHTIDDVQGAYCIEDRIVNFKMNQYLRSLKDYDKKLRSDFFSGTQKYTKDPLQQFWARELNQVLDDSAARGYAQDVRTLLNYWSTTEDLGNNVVSILQRRLDISTDEDPSAKGGDRGTDSSAVRLDGYPCQIDGVLAKSQLANGNDGDMDPWQVVADRSVHHPSICIIALIRNEGQFLDEWIAFHWLQGIRKFILFDDGSEDGTRKLLDKYIQRGIVDYRTVDRSAPHITKDKGHIRIKMDYINACLKEISAAREEHGLHWVLLADADEFAYAKNPNMTLAQALEAHYKGEICVNIFRKDFGSSGHIFRPKSGLVIENYVHSARHHRTSAPRKLIINLKPHNESIKVTRVPDTHQLLNPKEVQCIDNSQSQLQMNQYLRSLEDYDVRVKTFYLPSDQKYKTDPLRHFWDRNQHEFFDDSAPQRYACHVRLLLLYLLKDGQADSYGQSSGTFDGDLLETNVVASSLLTPEDSSLDNFGTTTAGLASSPSGAACASTSTGLLSKDPWAAVAERSSQQPRIAICSAIRNEGRDIEEWIAFHWLQGVRKFILYDDGSMDDTVQRLQKYVQRNIVDLRTLNRSIEGAPPERGHVGIQMAHVNACLEEMWTVRDVQGIDWVLLHDADEYAYPTDLADMTLAQALSNHYKDDPCVTIYRKDFGTSGHVYRPETGLMIENYVLSADGYRRDPDKLIINLRPLNESNRVKHVYGAHKVFHWRVRKDNICSIDKLQHLQMNHYLRSLEDYDLKVNTFYLATDDKYKIDPLKHFWERDRTEVIDDSAKQRYACKVRTLLAYMQEDRAEFVPSVHALSRLALAVDAPLSSSYLAAHAFGLKTIRRKTSSASSINKPSVTNDKLLSQLLGPHDPAAHPLLTDSFQEYPCQADQDTTSTSHTTTALFASQQLSSSHDPWATVAERSVHESTIAICALVCNDALFLDEWIAYHWLQGVRKFVLYDDNSVDFTHAVLDKYVQRGIVDLRKVDRSVEPVTMKGHHMGIEMMHINSCLMELQTLHETPDFDWVLFSNVDEFAYAKEAGLTLAESLDIYYKDQPCVHFFRTDFGSSSRLYRPQSGLTIENYILSGLSFRSRVPRKLVVNLRPQDVTKSISTIYSTHLVHKPLLNDTAESRVCLDDEKQYLEMNHYLKSLEDYEVKAKTYHLPTDLKYKKNFLAEFWERDKNEVVNDAAPRRFACELRALLGYWAQDAGDGKQIKAGKKRQLNTSGTIFEDGEEVKEDQRRFSKLREKRAMEIDQECFRHGHGSIHFLHMRKAGGSTIHKALLPLFNSGRLFRSEGFTFNITCLAEAGSMLHVTNLREPISRIVSHFYYEGQYKDLHDPVRHRRRTTMDEFHGFEPNQLQESGRLKQLFNETMTFPEYVRYILDKYDSDPEVYRRNRMREGVENYYIRTLTNRYRADTRRPIDETDLALAKEILGQFDVILIMEWLNDAEMAQYLDSVLGTNGTVFPHENSVKPAQKTTGKDSIDEATMHRLRELNHYDLELYEWAKNFTKSRMEATKQRQQQQQQQQQNHKDQEQEQDRPDANTDADSSIAPFDMTQCRPLPPIPEYTVHGIAYADLLAKPVVYLPVCNHPFYKEGEREKWQEGLAKALPEIKRGRGKRKS